VRICLSDGSAFGPCGGEVTPGRDDCTTPGDEDCDGAAARCGTGDHLFSRKFDAAFPFAVAGGAQGRVALTGHLGGMQDFGGVQLQTVGQGDPFIAVYDANDGLSFAESFPCTSYAPGTAVALDAVGGVAVVGDFNGTIDLGDGPITSGDSFIVRLDASGGHVWSRPIVAGMQSKPYGVALDASGNLYTAGSLEGGADFGGGFVPGNGSNDVFVVKLDASGNHVWSKLHGDSDIQVATAIAVDGAGNVFVAGLFYGSVSFGGPTLSSAGQTDGFLVKLDATGNHVWTKQLGGPSNQASLGVACDTSGNVVVAGVQEGTVDYGGGALTASGSDVFVARYAANGSHVWSKLFGDGAEQVAWAVAVDASSNVVVTGDFFGTISFGGTTLVSAGERDVFLAKLSPTGSHVWSKRFGDAATANGLAVAVDTNGRIAAAGHFSGTIGFGGATLTANPNAVAGYIARFEP
jgi:hypothetical protein